MGGLQSQHFLELLVHKLILLIGLHTAIAVPSHIVHNSEHRQGLVLPGAAQCLDHGAEGARPADARTAVHQEQVLVLGHVDCVVDQELEQLLAGLAQGFAHVAPIRPLYTPNFTWMCSTILSPLSPLTRIRVLVNSGSIFWVDRHLRVRLTLGSLTSRPV